LHFAQLTYRLRKPLIADHVLLGSRRVH